MFKTAIITLVNCYVAKVKNQSLCFVIGWYNIKNFKNVERFNKHTKTMVIFFGLEHDELTTINY